MSALVVTYAPEYVEDLENIYAYISSELGSPAAARGQIRRIRDAAASLGVMPTRRPLSRNAALAGMGVRLLQVGNYFVLFVVDEAARLVKVSRVVYARVSLDEVARGLS